MAMGGALMVLAGHWELIRRFGTVLPYRDSWQLTGVELLGPWVDGTLGPGAFLQSLNDHWPVLTRLLSFGLVSLNGQWNNLLETTVNAGILALAVAVFLRTILPGMARAPATIFAVMTGVVMALPITWENTLWGIQSLPYLQILLSLVYFRGVATARAIDARWAATQVVGGLVLLTQHSAIIAQVAVVPLLGWQWWRGVADRGAVLASLGVAVATLVGFGLFVPAMETTAHMRADSWALGVEVTLRQLAWPTGHPGWAFLLWAPWLVLALDRLGRRRVTPALAFLLVTGLWVGGQAAAIGYGRGAGALTHVSRYGDFMALGFLVNLASLLVLAQRWWSRPLARGAWVVLGVTMLVVAWPGFRWETMGSHTEFNLSRRPAENAANLQRVGDYIATRDPAALALENGGATLFTYPPAVQGLLDRAGFRALLPPETGAPESRSDHGRLGGLVAAMLWQPWMLAVAGLGGIAWGVGRFRSDTDNHPVGGLAPDVSGWTPRGSLLGAVGAAVLMTGLLAVWPDPLVFDADRRLRLGFAPPDAPITVRDDLQWALVSEHDADAAKMPGAVLSHPVAWRELATGTALDGATTTRGVFASSAFTIEADRLAVLFTGHPCAPGSAMRWRLDPPHGGEAEWRAYVGPNPAGDWDCWSEDVSAHRGWKASLYLFDGREDAVGWVGVMAPVLTNDAEWPEGWLTRLRIEQANASHRVVAGAAAVLWLLSLVAGAWQFRRSADRG